MENTLYLEVAKQPRVPKRQELWILKHKGSSKKKEREIVLSTGRNLKNQNEFQISCTVLRKQHASLEMDNDHAG